MENIKEKETAKFTIIAERSISPNSDTEIVWQTIEFEYLTEKEAIFLDGILHYRKWETTIKKIVVVEFLQNESA